MKVLKRLLKCSSNPLEDALLGALGPWALRVPIIGLRRRVGALPPPHPPGIGAFGADAGALGRGRPVVKVGRSSLKQVEQFDRMLNMEEDSRSPLESPAMFNSLSNYSKLF